MRYPIVLQPSGLLSRDPDLVFRLQRVAVPAAIAVETPPPVVLPPGVTIGAGSDSFAAATVIPCEEFLDVFAAYTYNKTYGTETSEPNVASNQTPRKTAWWKITVPADKTVYLDLDLEWSFSNDISADTQMAVYRLIGAPSFSNLTKLIESEDVNGEFFFSRLSPIRCLGNISGQPTGTVYYVQVGDYNASALNNICYVLRVSVSFRKPGVRPDDGHNPND